MKRLAVCLLLVASPLMAAEQAEEYRARTVNLLMEAYNDPMTLEYCTGNAGGIVEVTLTLDDDSEIVVPVDCAMWARWYRMKK